MKILLILPHDETYRRGGFFRRSLSYAPLTLTTLAALVPPELEAQLELVDEGVQAPVRPQAGYAVVGITCVTASAPRAYELAEAFRKLGSRVVLGGSHPTLNPQEGLAHADAVVTGPAEQAWPCCARGPAAKRAAAYWPVASPGLIRLPHHAVTCCHRDDTCPSRRCSPCAAA